MKLDRYIMDLLSLLEKNSDGKLESYQLIPELIRGEIASISWTPVLELDDHGHLVRVNSSIKVSYYEHEKIAAKN